MKFKKVCAIICCIAMVGSMAGCSTIDNTDTSSSYSVDDSDNTAVLEAAREDVVQYLTDGALKNEDIAMTVNGEDVQASYLLYWLASNITDYGYSDPSEMEEDDGNGQTVGDMLLDGARDSTTYNVAISQQAKKNNIELNDDEKSQLNEYLDSLDQNSLLRYSTTEDDQKSIYESYLYTMDLWNLLYGDNGTEKVTDDDLKDYMGDNEYFTVDYMYFGNSDDSDEAAAKSMERAEAVYNELKDVSEDEFENEFSELQGDSDISETDHTFYLGGGENEQFANGVSDMQIGDTKIIQTDNAVYIAHRNELNTDSIKEECAYNMFNEQLAQWSDEANVKTNKNYDKIDVTSFCEKLLNLQEVITSSETEDQESEEPATNSTSESTPLPDTSAETDTENN